ncbi:hypothetical protein [Litoreibacter roseus]|uniref:Uncharacterized protein n=1 Tax=Litoreibacter roseus TaxID=2601869 RepID=A0A6N6JB52_9RHOB|nr:hypothetical protein [Litoreibacter roseus]GFE63405.1 hypothetical protein KIN_04790 [Litoreibacter roseus]
MPSSPNLVTADTQRFNVSITTFEATVAGQSNQFSYHEIENCAVIIGAPDAVLRLIDWDAVLDGKRKLS